MRRRSLFSRSPPHRNQSQASECRLYTIFLSTGGIQNSNCYLTKYITMEYCIMKYCIMEYCIMEPSHGRGAAAEDSKKFMRS